MTVQFPRSVGQAALIEELGLKVPLPAVRSQVTSGARRTVTTANGLTTEFYPKTYLVEGIYPNLKFAMRYEPLDLRVLNATFESVDRNVLTEEISKEPTGMFARRIWYLYEHLTGERLDLPDAARTGYVDLLNTKLQFAAKPRRVSRQWVNDNLPGDRLYCPMIRQTERLEAFAAQKLDERAQELVRTCDPHILARAVNYLFTKETKSSFAIEGEEVSRDRSQRFVAALSRAANFDTSSKAQFIELQNSIISDPRFTASDYRDRQSFVGQTMSDYSQQIHFICPKPDDVTELIEGWMNCLERVEQGNVDPVAVAAVAAFGFVFIHPFEDGNGRIHRFLVHHVLSKLGFTPNNILFPVSAVMLRDLAAYDRILETFSSSVNPLIEYDFDEDQTMTVYGETAHLYRYWDATEFAEYLYGCIAETIETDLKEELGFLEVFDHATRATMGIVDMPDHRASLLVRMILQNKGTLSKGKRNKFAELSDEEIHAIETAISTVSRKEY